MFIGYFLCFEVDLREMIIFLLWCSIVVIDLKIIIYKVMGNIDYLNMVGIKIVKIVVIVMMVM